MIGGGAVYAAFLPHADRLVVTDVDLDVPGDTWAPEIGPGWRRVGRGRRSEGWSVSSSAGCGTRVVGVRTGESGRALGRFLP